jgi:hypothetical protein
MGVEMATIAGAAVGRRRRHAPPPERGATAVLVAASLLALMGFAALAVDLGAGWNERRQDQSASDVASMVAVQFARGSSNIATAANNGANEAIAVANASLDTPFTPADWAACVDPDRPAKYTRVSGVSPCISFSANLQEARVRTPIAEVATSFGRVLGAASIDTDAAAEAKADLGQTGRVLPFGLPGGSAGDTEICLRTTPQTPQSGPCSRNEQGNFGTLDFSLYGNATIGTQQTCGNAQAQSKLTTNMAVGVDHPLGTLDGQNRHDHDYCPIFLAEPNRVPGQTGQGSALWPGMVGGTSALVSPAAPGRLARGTNRITAESGSPQIDNTPLWAYIDTSATRPPSCGAVTTNEGMATCIADWRSGSYSDPLFTTAISNAVRFGAVPLLDRAEWANGTLPGGYGIVDILPVYIQATLWGCNANSCTITHVPGASMPAAGANCVGWSTTSCGLGRNVGGNSRLSAVTAFLLDIDMFPESIRVDFPNAPGNLDIALTR